MRFISTLVLLCFIGILFYTAGSLPDVGAQDSPPSIHVSPRYIEKGYEEVKSPNLVTAVLADYRAYDTLGETTVIFAAGIAAVMILRADNKKDRQGGRKK